MVAHSHKTELPYNAGLVIMDRPDLATLSLVYDSILLPALTETGCLEFRRPYGSRGKFKLSGDGVVDDIIFEDHHGKNYRTNAYIEDWEKDHRLLYHEGVLRRFAPPKDGLDSSALRQPAIKDDLGSAFYRWHKRGLDNKTEREMANLVSLPSPVSGRLGGILDIDGKKFEVRYFWQDHFLHLLRTDIELSGAFQAPTDTPSIDNLKALMAHKIFSLIIPRLSELSAEQIMAVREKTKATREAFGFHLQSLCADLSDAMIKGAPWHDTVRHAEFVVATKLTPQFFEFRRQLAAEKMGFWKNVLDAAGKILSIEAVPWTPKFYGEVIAALMPGLDAVVKKKERVTNNYQALQFLRTVEASAAGHDDPRSRSSRWWPARQVRKS